MPALPNKLLLCALLAASCVSGAHATTPVVPPDPAFAALADEFFDDYYFPNNPTLATQTGIHRYDDKLEDYSHAQIDKEIAELKKYEARFAALDRSSLGEMARGDLDLVLNNIRSTRLTLETIRPWEKNPDIYSSGITNSAFVIMERKFAPAAERLRLLIAREKQMPAALDAARANLKNPPKIFTEIALEQLPGLIDFFKQDVPSAFTDVSDAALKKEFAASNGAVIKALGDYQAWLKSDVLPKSHGDFRIGAKVFSEKLKYDEMVDLPLDKLVALDEANMKANQAEFAKVAKELDPNKTPREVLAELAADHPQPDKLLDTFRATFDTLIGFINSHHIITIPSTVRPTLEETPPFMRATTFASMDTPGPYETKATTAYFNVTLPEKDWPKQRIDEFMAQFSYPVITSVATHEAYPGHYVQFLWMHKVNDRVRKLLGSATNAEGWAHYCEQMMLDQGLAQYEFPKDRRQQLLLRLGQLQDALLRNARFIVGIKLHTGQMTLDQAKQFFVTEGYQSPAVGEVETKRGTSDPTYLYYTLGKLEILKLRADVEKKEGANFNLEKFHDDFMQHGFAPIAIVRREMLQDNSPVL